MEIKPIYAGSNWLRDNMPKGKTLSEVGEKATDFLGELFLGIYHIDRDVLRNPEAFCGSHVSINLTSKCFSTYDNNQLTRMVLLAHAMSLRVEIEAVAPRTIRMLIHQREPMEAVPSSMPSWKRHPSIEQAVEAFYRQYASEEARVEGNRGE